MMRMKVAVTDHKLGDSEPLHCDTHTHTRDDMHKFITLWYMNVRHSEHYYVDFDNTLHMLIIKTYMYM